MNRSHFYIYSVNPYDWSRVHPRAPACRRRAMRRRSANPRFLGAHRPDDESQVPPVVHRRWSSRLYAVVTAIYRKRPVWMVSFSASEASLSEGLRAACASTAMLALGNLLHDPIFAWAAIGAFWTCLADAAGSNRARFASMMGFALLSTLCGGLTAFASGAGTGFAALALLVFTTLGAFGRIWGAATSQVTILAATACVVMVDRPMHDARAGFAFLGVYLVGCLFADRAESERVAHSSVRREPLRRCAPCICGSPTSRWTARVCSNSAQRSREWATHAAKFRADARAALERSRKALAQRARVANGRPGRPTTRCSAC